MPWAVKRPWFGASSRRSDMDANDQSIVHALITSPFCVTPPYEVLSCFRVQSADQWSAKVRHTRNTEEVTCPDCLRRMVQDVVSS